MELRGLQIQPVQGRPESTSVDTQADIDAELAVVNARIADIEQRLSGTQRVEGYTLQGVAKLLADCNQENKALKSEIATLRELVGADRKSVV